MSRKNQRTWDLAELLSVIGFVFELLRVVVDALRKRDGTIEHLRRLLKEPPLVDKVFDLIVNKDNSMSPSLRLVLDLLETGKAVYQDGPQKKCRLSVVDYGVNQTLFQVGDLQTENFGKQGDGAYISGKELCSRAETLRANLGILDLKFLLEREAEIPVRLQKNYLLFPGTVLQSPRACYIAYLVFNEGRWQLEFEELPGAFYSNRDRLLRSAATPG